MRQTLLCVLVALGLHTVSAQAEPEFERSPYNDASPEMLPVNHVRIKANVAQGLDLALEVWAPAVPGPLPVVFFQTGLNGLAPAPAYDETMNKIAARGIVAVIPFIDFGAAVNAKILGKRFAGTFDWMQGHLEEALAAKLPAGVAPKINKQQFVISGHSSAAKAIMAMYREVKGKLAGIMFIDPVNSDPTNSTLPAIPPEETIDDQVPLLVLATGLGKEPGRDWRGYWPPCAPDESSGPYFYDHFSSPKWFVQAADYGHADMLEGVYLKALRATRFCKVAEDQNPSAFRTFIAGALTAFVRTVTHADGTMERYMTEESSIPVKTVLRHEADGYDR